MCDLRGLSKYEVNQHYFEFVRNATKEEREKHGWNNDRHIRGIYKCKECGELNYFRKNNFESHLQVCKNECNGTGYGKGVVIHGYNDLETVRPELVKYFTNPEDAKKYTYGSFQKVQLKCPECGKEKRMTLNTFSRYGFSCDYCSDGISYPEKIIQSILSLLNITFTKQLTYDNGRHKYDFYIKEWNAIFEMHGMQHYTGWNHNEQDLIRQQENDKFKRIDAIKHGILNENYHEIDCRYSTIEWCKPNIKKVLSKYIDIKILNSINWKQIDMQAQKSLKMKICRYWNEHKNENLITTDLEKIFGIERSTIRRYLNWGNKNGLCVYDGKEEQRKRHKRQSVYVNLIKENGEKWFDEPLSLIELSRRTGINDSALGRSLHNKKPLSKRNAKYDAKYIGSMVILAEETE